METKHKLLLLGVVAVGGYLLYKNLGSVADPSAAIPDVSPTFKPTAQSTLAEMKADLLNWSQRNEEHWQGKQPAIYAAVLQQGETGIKNMHALLWDIWAENSGLDPYQVNWDGSAQPDRAKSVGAWWESLSASVGL